jgi:hypothetical protein
MMKHSEMLRAFNALLCFNFCSSIAFEHATPIVLLQPSFHCSPPASCPALPPINLLVLKSWNCFTHSTLFLSFSAQVQRLDMLRPLFNDLLQPSFHRCFC